MDNGGEVGRSATGVLSGRNGGKSSQRAGVFLRPGRSSCNSGASIPDASGRPGHARTRTTSGNAPSVGGRSLIRCSRHGRSFWWLAVEARKPRHPSGAGVRRAIPAGRVPKTPYRSAARSSLSMSSARRSSRRSYSCGISRCGCIFASGGHEPKRLVAGQPRPTTAAYRDYEDAVARSGRPPRASRGGSGHHDSGRSTALPDRCDGPSALL